MNLTTCSWEHPETVGLCGSVDLLSGLDCGPSPQAQSLAQAGQSSRCVVWLLHWAGLRRHGELSTSPCHPEREAIARRDKGDPKTSSMSCFSCKVNGTPGLGIRDIHSNSTGSELKTHLDLLPFAGPMSTGLEEPSKKPSSLRWAQQ